MSATKPASFLFRDLTPGQQHEMLLAAKKNLREIPGLETRSDPVFDLTPKDDVMEIRVGDYYSNVAKDNAVKVKDFIAANKFTLASSAPTVIYMHLGDFLVLFAKFRIEILGEQCADGGTCHHHCTTTCFRKDGCVPLTLSGLKDDWTAPPDEPLKLDPKMVTYVDGDKILFNGMVNQIDRTVSYMGFTIKPKLDMGSSPHLSHANSYRTGWVVVDEKGCNAMPGASYSTSILEAKASIDIWIQAEFNAEKFWQLMEPFRW
jgi:hypothetical protein